MRIPLKIIEQKGLFFVANGDRQYSVARIATKR